MTDIPHFDMPFRYVNGTPVVNAQDSIGDIAACVYVIAATEPGSREDIPEFGVTDPTFSQEPVNGSRLLAQVRQWEPRAQLLLDEAPGVYDATITTVNLTVRGTE